MTADRLARAVRDRLGLGRLLPLGGRADGAWITERAAEAVLRRSARGVPGVSLGALRIAPADPAEADRADEADEADDVNDVNDVNDVSEAVVPPPSALPPGPLRVSADFAATASVPLPGTASLLRAALASAATEGLGLTVTEVDLRVTGLLDTGPPDEEPETSPEPAREPWASGAEAGPEEARAAAAVLSLAGVDRLTAVLGGRPVHLALGERQGEAAPPRRHARVEIAVRMEHRALDVARAVRVAVGGVLPDHPAVAVVVTAVG
ncbi:nucleopolyhedrovirus P10 family protein [Streptomyces sp. NPDC059582]|uniref:nucleopolyhedrovirus P10 family protein n=1 Tax=Streptomyces sp. NPDC059582 TaxID=3346875 RepID=UPI0036C2F449